ncbi:hypothetical protein [Telmatospirillum sp.]|uniref:hypothetical protein n=1 Tax=Telmatospirillum sp. TaxID=2079197 RepID=UPI0028504C84|nr:hypothetical protein [Telmatospirillum sp.]MDR3438308.1 hypothetical protein [Telmatospirillum sp.]
MAAGNKSIHIGDLFLSDGRQRPVWVVDSIINMPRGETMIRLALVDGIAKVTIPAINLGFGFRPVRQAAVLAG